MVKGVDIFKSYFEGFEDHYAVIGGAACELLFDEAGLEFRATKDIDMVLCVKLVDAKFAARFRQFIEDGEYEARQRSDGHKEFYRFHKPGNDAFPFMIELFSKAPDGLDFSEGMELAKIPVEEEIISLSAILLDEVYYEALLNGRKSVSGVTILDETLLIPFKAKAYLDLKARADRGEKVDAKNIKKHRNDVVRLAQLLSADVQIDVDGAIIADVASYLDQVEPDETLDPKSFNVDMTRGEACQLLRDAYGVQGDGGHA